MLHSYEAHLQGNQVIWLGIAPPVRLTPRRIVVVLDDAANDTPMDSITPIFNRARGALGRGKREALLAELSQSRQAWER